MNYGFGYRKKSKEDILDRKHKIKTHGKDIWNVLHITSVYLPETLNDEEKEDLNSLFKGILYFGTKFNESWNKSTMDYINSNPLKLSSRDDAMFWVCKFHNHVNVKLEKDLFECTKENLAKRWGNYENIFTGNKGVNNNLATI
jgi:hypothetical protein